MKISRVSVAMALVLSSCASLETPTGPAWLTAPTRTVDAGYLVYVGTAEARTRDEAQRDAEAVALTDLALECSFVPKGARVEDRFAADLGDRVRASAKVATTLEECDAARKADTPEEIKLLANEPMNALVKKYQDRTMTAPPSEAAPPPADIQNEADYYAARQYVFFQKQLIILGGVSYLPGTSMSEELTARLRDRVHPILQFERQHPGPVYRAAPLRERPAPMSSSSSPWSAPSSSPRHFSPPRFNGMPAVRPPPAPRFQVHPRRR